MTAKTKTRGGALIVVALVVSALVVISQYGSKSKNKKDEEQPVTLSVLFTPEKRVTFVHVTVTLDGAVIVNSDKVKESPWHTEVLVRRGQTVTLTAAQTVPAKLSCAVNGDVQETRDLSGLVVCKYRRP